MSTDGIGTLLRKREELLAQVQGLQSAIFHIDQALALIGYGKARVARRFAKGMDQTDDKLRKRIIFSVKDVRKRLAARGA
jgi:hypothetical protein